MGQQVLTSTSDSIVSFPVTADVTAGDYFYEWGDGSFGWPKAATVSVGQTRVIAGANRTLEFLTAGGRAASAGPILEVATYTGSTVTTNTVTTASASLQAFAGYQAKVATLTNGNFVSVYMSALNTLSAKIFNSAGAQVGSTLSVSTTVASAAATLFTGTVGIFDVAGLSTGGYVVIFKHSSLGTLHIATVSAANAIVSGPTLINAAVSTSSCTPMTVAADNNGGYLIAFLNSNAVRAAYYNSANTYVGGMTSVIDFNSHFDGGTYGGYPQAFVLNNGAMGVASSGYGNSICSGQNGNVITISSLNATATATTNSVSKSAGFSGNAVQGAVTVAASSTNSNYALLVGTQETGTVANTMLIQAFTINSAGGTISSVASAEMSGVVRSSKPQLIANPDGTYVLIYKESASVTRRRDVSATGTLLGSPVTIDSAATMDYVSACPLAYEAAVALTPTATNYPSQLILQTDTVTNGRTFVGATTYAPTTGYYLKGIALETVAAGGICKVGTKGRFALGGSYLSWSVSFDYVGTTRSGTNIIKGNSGSVTTTTVTLKGLK